jgi:urease accessory protein
MRAVAVAPAGAWATGLEVDRVLLDYDRRHRRRVLLTTERGAEMLLDLPHAARLRHGDGLLLEDGRVVAVAARPEPLLEITAADADALTRIAWHLGNRHLPVQLLPGALRIRADHVIADMARGLGARVREIGAAFDPEAGAYAAGGTGHHHHDDGHDDDGHDDGGDPHHHH